MDDEQNAELEIRTHGCVAPLRVARCVNKLQERIEKHLRGLLEYNAMLFGISAETDAAQFVFDIHESSLAWVFKTSIRMLMGLEKRHPVC